ncbi:DENN domain-containing protein 3-like [Xenia sp. Carnegie-2017]|uniref:DENN domain-containing protein 3-like n=1 Tax=Xenia sp. Carnegie-2017 TaxID=2897299 RepID=UPI001F03AC61|nr:DENN domain-containing protein 3-like [Xenia sp. Carnegie-2017]
MRKNKKVAGSFRVRKQLIFEGVPRYPVGKDDFIERVMLCQITDNTKTAERLFSVLITYLGGKTIHPNTFSDLYYTLNQEDTQAQSMDVEGVTIEEREYAIKVSSLCTTNFGVGRLLLTNLRLLFMAEGTPSCRQLTRLLNIYNIEKYQHYYLLSRGVPAIRVVVKDKTLKPFFACLKTERDTWCAYLEEMADCHERAETLRDPQFISLGAQNVRLADALLKSGVPHSKALTMCYFTRTNEPAKEISAETDEFLVQRLNPSQMDTATATVEALAYLPKFDTGCTLYYEQIWCGMASGSIVIFKRAMDDERWDFETQIFCTNDRISCLLAVGDSQVWAGSCDATIYVFDRFTYKANQHLDAHSDIISAIFVQPQNEKIVWSASLNGHIIGWDAENLTIYKQIRLNYQSKTCVSFLLIGNQFWCDTKSSIVVLDTERNIEHVLELKDGNNVLSIDCMTAVSSNEVWCGCGKRAKIAVFNTKTLTYTILPIQTKEKDVALTKMALMGSEIWIGNKNGLIIVVNLTRKETLGKDRELRVKKTLKIHDDSVRSICVINGGYVATGPGSKDGKIAIWRRKEKTKDDLGFVTFSTKQVNDAVKFDKVTTVRPTDKSAFFDFLK